MAAAAAAAGAAREFFPLHTRIRYTGTRDGNIFILHRRRKKIFFKKRARTKTAYYNI